MDSHRVAPAPEAEAQGRNDWKDIKGYEEYRISKGGEVWRKDGYGSDGRSIRAHPISILTACNKTKYVCLWNNGKRKNIMLHKLYADAFGVSEKQAIQILYKAKIESQSAVRNVRKLLMEDIEELKAQQAAGKNREKEIRCLEFFLIQVNNTYAGDAAGMQNE